MKCLFADTVMHGEDEKKSYITSPLQNKLAEKLFQKSQNVMFDRLSEFHIQNFLVIKGLKRVSSIYIQFSSLQNTSTPEPLC